MPLMACFTGSLLLSVAVDRHARLQLEVRRDEHIRGEAMLRHRPAVEPTVISHVKEYELGRGRVLRIECVVEDREEILRRGRLQVNRVASSQKMGLRDRMG